ncbi:hypothetical protein [Pendulispora albinea]|uniref:Uncharacterized protein n=1 Tax=Pendulispora albinea TaxID=2741071 RepID=A0ABZ2MBE4_9BACT
MTMRACFTPLALAFCGLVACSGDDVGLGGPNDGQKPSDGTQKPETYPRLIVAGRDGVSIWNNATSLEGTPKPSAHLDFKGSPLGLGLNGDTLFVAASNVDSNFNTALYRFDGASKLTEGAKPASSIPGTAFRGSGQQSGFSGHVRIQADSRHNAWIHNATSGGTVHVLPTGANAPVARFGPVGQYTTYDEAGDRLFGSTVGGRFFPVWANASTKTGDIQNSDYDFSTVNPQHMAIAGNRLYSNAVQLQQEKGFSDISIWNDIANIRSSKAPDIVMANACAATDDRPTYIAHVAVVNDVLLAVTGTYLKNASGSASSKVCIFKGASAITAGRAPDAVASVADSLITGSGSDKAWLSKDDHLFLLDAGGIVIFKNATTNPTYVARLFYDNAGAVDFLLLE